MSVYEFEEVKLESAAVVSKLEVPTSSVSSKLLACRACLATDTKLFNLHDNNLAQMFADLTDNWLQLAMADGYPQHICCICQTLLRKAASFQKMCRQSHYKLQDLCDSEPELTTDHIRITQRNIPDSLYNLTKTQPLLVEFIPENALNDDILLKEDDNALKIKSVYPKVKRKYISKDASPKLKRFKLESSLKQSEVNKKVTRKDKRTKSTKENVGNLIKIEINKVEPNIEFIETANIDNDNNDSDDDNFKLNDCEAKSKRKLSRKRVKSKEDINIEIPQTTCKKNYDQMMEFSHKYNMDMFLLSHKEQLANVLEKKNSVRYRGATHKCELCYRVFSKEDQLNHHVKTFHPSSAPLACRYCRYRFLSRRRLLQHHRNVHWRRFVCRQCGHRTSCSGQVQKHFKLHENPKVAHHKCLLCWKSFLDKKTLRVHTRVSHAQARCHVCGDQFDHADRYATHLQTAHRQALSFRCESCGLNFLSGEALNRHQGGPCRTECRPCGQCGAGFDNDEALSQHLRETHGKQCRRCAYIYVSEKEYRQHYYQVHKVRLRVPDESGHRDRNATQTVPSNALCDICGLTLSCPSDLKKHQLVHTGERRHQCYLCDKRFRLDRDLVTHMKSHSDERPFQCAECPKAFKLKTALMRHLLIHQNIRRYRCDICDRTFVQSSALNVHVNGVHKKMPRNTTYKRPKKKLTDPKKKVNSTNKVKRKRKGAEELYVDNSYVTETNPEVNFGGYVGQ